MFRPYFERLSRELDTVLICAVCEAAEIKTWSGYAFGCDEVLTICPECGATEQGTIEVDAQEWEEGRTVRRREDG